MHAAGFPTWFGRRDGGRGASPGRLTTKRCWPHPSTGCPNRANQSSAWSPSPRIAIWSRSRTSSRSSSSSSAGRPRRSSRCIGTGATRALLHLQTVGEAGPGPRLHISIHDRFRVGKETLTGAAVDAELRLDPSDARLLGRWIAKRYTRPAFPDAFNARLVAVDGRLERLHKSREGEIVTGVFLDVADDENADDVAYEIAVRITARTEAWDDEATLAALSRFEERFRRSLTIVRVSSSPTTTYRPSRKTI